jgi:hypothetical protein
MVGDEKYLLDEIRLVEESMKDISDKVSDIDKTLVEYRIAFEHHSHADEKMYEELKRMNDILSINTESLRTHIRRTELLEQAAVKLDGRLSDIEIKKIQSEAVKKWIVDSSMLTGKVLAVITALVGLAAMVPSFIQWLMR